MNKNWIRLCAGTLLISLLGSGCASPAQPRETQAAKNQTTQAATEALVTEPSQAVQNAIPSLRGNILDRNGEILVSSRECQDLVLDPQVFGASENQNDSLLLLYGQCKELGLSCRDTLPITPTAPYAYTPSLDAGSQREFEDYLENHSLSSQLSASEVLEQLASQYAIPETWTSDDTRAVVGMRYALETANGPHCLVVSDISDKDLTAMEALQIPGLSGKIGSLRQYHTPYAAHLLGYLDGDSAVSGIEEAFDSELRAGNSIETTLDLHIQEVAETALTQRMQQLKDPDSYPGNNDAEDARGAAVVVMEVKTGKVLACASYPSFDLSTLQTNAQALQADPMLPLRNRALNACYAPGAVYFPCTLTAAMEDGKLAYQETIKTKGVFDKYPGFEPACMLYALAPGATHGTIDASDALALSCNYFFYELGDRLTIEGLDETAKGFGLGMHTGIEVSEEVGRRANPDTKAQLYVGLDSNWFVGDKIISAIGQSENRFTPLQLAVYASTLANQGTRYQATVLSRVISPDGQEVIREQKPKILTQMEISPETYETYVTGMNQAIQSRGGTARNYFGGRQDPNGQGSFPVNVCAKTGSAEHAGSGSDHASLICFAPMENPEIAVAVYGENAAHGSWLVPVAQEILTAYFEG